MELEKFEEIVGLNLSYVMIRDMVVDNIVAKKQFANIESLNLEMTLVSQRTLSNVS